MKARGVWDIFPPMSQLSGQRSPAPAADPSQRVDVKRAFMCLFHQKGWAMTTLLGSLFMFIPVVGPIAFAGYSVRLLKHMVTTGDDRNLPHLDGFGDLMGLGMMPFLLSMLWSFPLVFLVYAYIGIAALVVLAGSVGAGAALSAMGMDADASALVALAVAVVLGSAATILMFVLMFLVSYPLQAMNTFVDLTGKIEYGWNVKLVKTYLRTLRPEYRRAFFGLMLGNFVMFCIAMAFSILTLGIGYLPVLMLMMVCMAFASSHVQAQLYRIYLARGGEPLPLDPRI